jgi:exodeoxyribonuclease VII large subunit
MQGEDAESSIIHALENIHRYANLFDVVVIIRGGGSQADLSCFNNYRLALHVAQFPLPVLTGIGHEKDETVVDLVAYEQLKTPTAVAEYLLSCFLNEDEHINEMGGRLLEMANEKVGTEKVRISGMGYQCSMTVRQHLIRQNAVLQHKKLGLAHACQSATAVEHHKINITLKDIRISSGRKFQECMQKLESTRKLFIHASKSGIGQLLHHLSILENRNRYLSPLEILKRGYSITRQNGKIVKDGTLLNKGDFLETHFYKGRRKSRVVD